MKNSDIIFHRGGIWEDLRHFLGRRKRARAQRTFVYCPVCKEELIGSEFNFLFDDERGVGYSCTNCGTDSLWNFDAPAPILLKYGLAQDHGGHLITKAIRPR